MKGPLLKILALPLLACAPSAAHAQNPAGAVAIEGCTAFQGPIDLHSKDGRPIPAEAHIQMDAPIRIKAGDIFSFYHNGVGSWRAADVRGNTFSGYFIFNHQTDRRNGLIKLAYIDDPAGVAHPKVVWVPEKSIAVFGISDAFFEKPYKDFVRAGSFLREYETLYIWKEWFVAEAKKAAPENIRALMTAFPDGANSTWGAVAIEDCLALESSMTATKPTKKQLRIKAGEVFHFDNGRFVFTERTSDGLVQMGYLQNGAAKGTAAWVPEKSVQYFQAEIKLPFETYSVGKAMMRHRLADRFVAAAKAAAPEAVQAKMGWADEYIARLPQASRARPNEPYIHAGPRKLFVADMTYEAGSFPESGETDSGTAVYWKSKGTSKMPTLVGERYATSKANTIFVSGEDIYVAGTRGAGGARRPVLWKNGVAEDLSDKRSRAAWEPWHVRAIGDDVYVAGLGEPVLVGDPQRLMLWKNGAETNLTANVPKNAMPSIKQISVSKNGDVYAAGNWGSGKMDGDMNWEREFRVLKNGKLLPHVAVSYKSYHSPMVVDAVELHLYVCGDDIFVHTVSGPPAVWKNGAPQELESLGEDRRTLQSIRYRLRSVYVSGDDLYVLGHTINERGEPLRAVEWINGKASYVQ